MTQTFFEKKIKPILIYVGTIGAALMSVGYIILMFVLVLGFKAQAYLTQALTFAVINAIVGFIIMQFLKIQGIDFAKELEDNKLVLKDYNEGLIDKKKSTHSLKYFWIKSIISDIGAKALTIGITTAGIIYIVIEGSQDYNMLLLSVVNLILFACLGLLSLVKAYEFYNNNYIPFLKDKINEREQAKKAMEMAKKEPIKQTDDMVHTDRGSDILVPSMDTCAAGYTNTEPVVLECGDCSDCVLGTSDNPGDTSTDSTDIIIEKNS